MRNIRIKQIDAFTTKTFKGNPAAVVVHAEGLSSRDMQKIALEMNLSETVFVLPPEDEQADLRLRWFTPSREVDLCGHATIAAFHALAEEGAYGLEVGEAQSFLVDTRSGNLTVDVEWKEMMPYIKFSLPIPRFFPYPGDIKLLAGALGLSELEFSPAVKPQIHDGGYCFIALHHEDSLEDLDPNFSVLSKLEEQYKVMGFVIFSTDVESEDTDWNLRFFAPAAGVNEDPVTGSAHGPLAAFLWTNGLLEKGLHFYNFIGKQGSHVGRSGTVHVGLAVDDQAIRELYIAGHAVTVMEANMMLGSAIKENV